MLRYLTAGETHGKCLITIVEGMPAGVKIDVDKINAMLKRRQQGYGRGGRMAIETDRAEILSGIRGGYTIGSPIAIKIENKDWESWENIMNSEEITNERVVTAPRPGHADLVGGLKYNHRDLRNVLERASARETAARVAAGAVAIQLLEQFAIYALTHTVNVGEVFDEIDTLDEEFFKRAVNSSVGFGSQEANKRAEEYIEKAKEMGESLGGIVETIYKNVPKGLGSYVQYDRKLDAKIAMSVMSIQAIKGVEIGKGFECAKEFGSKVHDEILYDGKFTRRTNNAGGIEGGMSNGEPIVIRAAMKPIPTLYTPLDTVDINTKESVKASVERSDICAVYACSVVVEACVGFEIAAAFLEKFGADCFDDIKKSYELYLKRIENY